jgi:microcystin-dependent protein
MSTNQVINDIEPRTQIISGAAQTVFNAAWTADVAASVLVYARASGVPANDSTQLVPDSNYNVTFIGSTQTVRVTFTLGQPLGDIITLVRDTISSRTNLYTNTNFTPSMLNQDFGIETMVQQQNQMYGRDFAPHYNFSATYTNTSDTDIDLVLPILEANQVWIKNPSNTAMVAATLSGSGIGVETVTGTANEVLVNNADAVNPIVGLPPAISAPGTFTIQGTVALDAVIDDDSMATATATNVPTSESVKAYVDSTGSGLVDSVTGTANEIDVGGTAADPVVSLSSTINTPGTFNIQTSTAVDAIIDDDSMATATDTNLSTSESIKVYVDSVAGGGFTVILTCLLGTTANLTGTYANGALGVGATLTNNSTQVALTIDGVLTQVADRILVKNQTSQLANGVYTVTTVGSGATDWVLTRATDYDIAAEIVPGTLVPVSSGTVNGGSTWLETATVTTVGTDPIVFSNYSQPGSTFVTLATTQTISGAKTFSNNVIVSGSSTLDLNATTAVDGVIDDDTMATASDTTLATSESIKAYVDSLGAGSSPIGSIISFALTAAPTGYLECDGAAISRTVYSDLFASIGTTWGVGDGVTTFNIPDMQRNTFVGSGGSGTATLGNAVGDTGGAETHTLTIAEMPAHTHTLDDVISRVDTNLAGEVSTNPWSTVTATGSTGGDGPHNIIQPSAVVLICIKTALASSSASGGNVGDFVDFGGTSAPAGCLVRDGAAVSRTTYAALFTVIGTTYGIGDGSTTFNLPDSQRRVSVGSGGAGTGTLGNSVGDTGGAEDITIKRVRRIGAADERVLTAREA